MANNEVPFRTFFFRYWSWNLLLDIGTALYLFYVASLFPVHLMKLLNEIPTTVIVLLVLFLRALIHLVLVIIKMFRGRYLQVFCLLIEIALMAGILYAGYYVIGLEFAGATLSVG